MKPGETRTFSLGVVECCVVFMPVPVRATWSVAPTQGARIDPDSGVLTIDASARSGSVFAVSANVENGRRIVSIKVHVFTPQDNRLIGLWREQAQFVCGSGEQVAPGQPIGQLSFRADGTFSVTWRPFEVYKDYWGTYTFGLTQGTLRLAASGGNYVPKDADWDGQISLDNEGRLILKDMWLGSRERVDSTNCGHLFRRIN